MATYEELGAQSGRAKALTLFNEDPFGFASGLAEKRTQAFLSSGAIGRVDEAKQQQAFLDNNVAFQKEYAQKRGLRGFSPSVMSASESRRFRSLFSSEATSEQEYYENFSGMIDRYKNTPEYLEAAFRQTGLNAEDAILFSSSFIGDYDIVRNYARYEKLGKEKVDEALMSRWGVRDKDSYESKLFSRYTSKLKNSGAFNRILGAMQTDETTNMERLRRFSRVFALSGLDIESVEEDISKRFSKVVVESGIMEQQVSGSQSVAEQAARGLTTFANPMTWFGGDQSTKVDVYAPRGAVEVEVDGEAQLVDRGVAYSYYNHDSNRKRLFANTFGYETSKEGWEKALSGGSANEDAINRLGFQISEKTEDGYVVRTVEGKKLFYSNGDFAGILEARANHDLDRLARTAKVVNYGPTQFAILDSAERPDGSTARPQVAAYLTVDEMDEGVRSVSRTLKEQVEDTVSGQVKAGVSAVGSGSLGLADELLGFVEDIMYSAEKSWADINKVWD